MASSTDSDSFENNVTDGILLQASQQYEDSIGQSRTSDIETNEYASSPVTEVRYYEMDETEFFLCNLLPRELQDEPSRDESKNNTIGREPHVQRSNCCLHSHVAVSLLTKAEREGSRVHLPTEKFVCKLQDAVLMSNVMTQIC